MGTHQQSVTIKQLGFIPSPYLCPRHEKLRKKLVRHPSVPHQMRGKASLGGHLCFFMPAAVLFPGTLKPLECQVQMRIAGCEQVAPGSRELVGSLGCSQDYFGVSTQ